MAAFTRANDYKTISMEKVLSPGLIQGSIKKCIKMMNKQGYGVFEWPDGRISLRSVVKWEIAWK